MAFFLYYRHTLKVLQDQVNPTLAEGFINKYCSATLYSPPMNVEIGLDACPASEEAAKASTLSDVYWKSFAAERTQSTVGCLPFFRDNSQS